MLQRKKSSYIEVKLVQNSKYPEKILKTFKSLGLNAKQGNTINVFLNQDGTIQKIILVFF